MNFEIFHIAWTVLLVLIFIGIILWAWSGKNKSRFKNAENLPFADEKSFSEYKNSQFEDKSHSAGLKDE